VFGKGDADGQVRTWRATANGIENCAAECSDGVLILDELGQADAREVSETVYLLANESGKARASRTGGPRPRRTWRVIFLSTGEITPEAKLSEAGLRPLAGQQVRLINLSADAGLGLGIFQDLHGMPNPAILADRLRDASRTLYGTAGPAFLDALARHRGINPEALRAAVREIRDCFIAEHLPAGSDGQVRSVAARFGLIAAAGELAQSYGVLPWPSGEARRAASSCFTSWLTEGGGVGAVEDLQAIEVTRAFIAAHGASRFELIQRRCRYGPAGQ
jgi:putative DNA primase/helicase